MDYSDQKCVIVVDSELPCGIIANTAAILGVTLGKQRPEIVGPDVSDQSGCCHLGIVALPVPVLRGSRELLRTIRQRLYEPEFGELTVVDFSETAQNCQVYEDFTKSLGETPEASLTYLGLGICGKKKLVNKLTGSMPLLR